MKTAIVGSGTAGWLVASRLSERGHDVVMIEAGAEIDPETGRSLDWLPAQADPRHRWSGLQVVRSDGRPPEDYLAARAVGGGSVINGMVATFGPAVDYGEWPLVDVERARLRLRDEWPIATLGPGPLGAAVLSCSDRPAGWQVEAAPLSIERHDGFEQAVRWPSRRLPFRGELRTGAAVTRCVLDGRRVVGVELADGELIEAEHTIVCAGAIHTPGLLLASGIDNGAVGRGLADHPSRVISIELDPAMQRASSSIGAAPAPITVLARWAGIDVLFMDHTGSGQRGRRFGAAIVVLMDPESTGSVGFNGGELDVRFGLLSSGDDEKRLDEGVSRALELLTASMGDEPAMTVEAGFGPVSHAAASCRSAVDAAGEVQGYAGVSVMDASALPTLPRAHPMMPTLVLAEAMSAEWLRRHGIGHHRVP